MGQVTVTLNGRSYKLRCGDGEEARLLELGAYVEGRLTQLTAQFGPVGDERLLVMSALMIADDLFDAKEALSAMQPAALPMPGEAKDAIAPVAELPALPEFGFAPAPALTHDPDAPSTIEPVDDQGRDSLLARAIRRSEAQTPVSINERLADARESANLQAGVRKP